MANDLTMDFNFLPFQATRQSNQASHQGARLQALSARQVEDKLKSARTAGLLALVGVAVLLLIQRASAALIQSELMPVDALETVMLLLTLASLAQAIKCYRLHANFSPAHLGEQWVVLYAASRLIPMIDAFLTEISQQGRELTRFEVKELLQHCDREMRAYRTRTQRPLS